MGKSQNSVIPAALRRRYSRLWRKNPQYQLIFTSAASPKTAMYIGEQGKPLVELKTDLDLVKSARPITKQRITARFNDKEASVVGEEMKFVEILEGKNRNRLQVYNFLLGRA
ncbi:unnamed protein product [Vicia faba]|uniref:Uncharacterized protein n=1 Tax=Vicia faba TaxID=3906 RepID=A0AAV1B832_VICFA|nr:unnamed protein product [Vicia faba]